MMSDTNLVQTEVESADPKAPQPVKVQNSKSSNRGKKRQAEGSGANPPKNNQNREKVQKLVEGGYGRRVQPFYTIHVSYSESRHISDAIYDAYVSFDPKFVPRSMSRHAYSLVNQVAVLVRATFIQLKLLGNNIEQEFPEFWMWYEKFKYVKFHNLIADYIESIGMVEYDGIAVIPHLQSIPLLMEDLDTCKWEVGADGKDRFNPEDMTGFDLRQALHMVDIPNYIRSTGRIVQFTKSMRTVKWEEIKGHSKLVVSRYHSPDGKTYGVSPTQLKLEDLDIGAVFNFWNSHRVREYGDSTQFPIRFMGDMIASDVILNGIVQRSLSRN